VLVGEAIRSCLEDDDGDDPDTIIRAELDGSVTIPVTTMSLQLAEQAGHVNSFIRSGGCA
jgi:hypothetical protein